MTGRVGQVARARRDSDLVMQAEANLDWATHCNDLECDEFSAGIQYNKLDSG